MGDAVDSDYYTDSLLRALRFDIAVPTYFTMGNHEYIHERGDASLERGLQDFAGYQVLRGKAVDIGSDLRIVGLDDVLFGCSLDSQIDSLKAELNTERYLLALYHRPDKEAVHTIANAGFDAQLAGHTHEGQVEPFRSLLHRLTPYVHGEYLIERAEDETESREDMPLSEPLMNLIVTSGAGLWGPPIRIGTRAEMMLITLLPEE